MNAIHPTPPLTSRLPHVGTTIFTVMSALALEHGAVNLGQGFPDFDCDPRLLDAVNDAMRAGLNQYPPMAGVPALREAVAHKIATMYGHAYDPGSEITITAGATQAIITVILAIVHPGDEVIVFEPCYDSYVPVIRLSGGVPVFVSLRYPDYTVNWDEVRRAITAKTRIILVNTPHNPTGTMWSADDMRQLQSIVDGTDILLIGDEVYEHIIFDGRRHESLLRYPDLRARSVVISSFGKTFHTTGWKVGYCVGPQALMAEVTRVHQFVTFTVHTPSQMAFAEFVRRDPAATALSGFYQQKRDRFLELTAGSRFKPLPCAGTYFQLMDYSAISHETDKEVAHRLIVEHGVASIPVSAFLYKDAGGPVLRFCFAKRDDTLRAAAERLVKI